MFGHLQPDEECSTLPKTAKSIQDALRNSRLGTLYQNHARSFSKYELAITKDYGSSDGSGLERKATCVQALKRLRTAKVVTNYKSLLPQMHLRGSAKNQDSAADFKILGVGDRR